MVRLIPHFFYQNDGFLVNLGFKLLQTCNVQQPQDELAFACIKIMSKRVIEGYVEYINEKTTYMQMKSCFNGTVVGLKILHICSKFPKIEYLSKKNQIDKNEVKYRVLKGLYKAKQVEYYDIAESLKRKFNNFVCYIGNKTLFQFYQIFSRLRPE